MKRVAVFAAAAVVVCAGCAVQSPPPVSDRVASYYSAIPTTGPAKAPEPFNKISPALLKPGTVAAFFGDSWTAGYAAKPATGGMVHIAAKQLGWDYRVHGGSGTGYLNPGAQMGNYVSRLGTLDVDPSVQVLVLQGGLNDAEKDLTKLPAAIDATLQVAREKFPKAQIILLGPANAGVSSGPLLRRVSGAIYTAAARHKLPFISPVDELWITATDYNQIIDITAVNHPSTEGHKYLGGRLAASIKELAG